ncbi:MAG: arsenite methyltransferase [bacterium]|nr:arsenite methyltransferase [bacterium]
MSTSTIARDSIATDRVATDSDEIRSQVAEAYTAALSRSQTSNGGCCCDCGDEQTAPAGIAAKTAGYDSEIAAHEETAVSSFGCGNPLAFAGVTPGQTVVDLGSGAGFDLLIAAEKVGPDGRVIGIDMTDAMIDASRQAAARAGFEQIEVRKGLIEKLPVDDGATDWVISNCVINLSPEKDRVFAEVHRVLAPGGRFSISDIVVEELPAEIRQHAAAYAACVAGAIREEEYVAGLRAAGLEDVEVSERQVYNAEQIRGIVASDLESFGIDPDTLEGYLGALEGKVWSARFEGRRA